MTAAALDILIATAQDQAARYLAADITYRRSEIQDALINQLERIWRSPSDWYQQHDRLILAALARLSSRTCEELYGRAFQIGRYSMAKRLAHSAGLGDELYQRARYAAARCITHYRLPGRLGGGQ